MNLKQGQVRGEQFYLHRDRHSLFGWEWKKSKQSVEAVVRGIRAGDKFPPVFVYKIDDCTFSIVGEYYVNTTDGERKDGGHTRSIGHNIMNAPLFCEIKTNRPEVMPGYPDPYGTIKIPDIVLVDDMSYYLMKKKWFPNYR